MSLLADTGGIMMLLLKNDFDFDVCVSVIEVVIIITFVI